MALIKIDYFSSYWHLHWWLGFSMAMLNNQMVYSWIWMEWHTYYAMLDCVYVYKQLYILYIQYIHKGYVYIYGETNNCVYINSLAYRLGKVPSWAESAPNVRSDWERMQMQAMANLSSTKAGILMCFYGDLMMFNGNWMAILWRRMVG